MTIELTFEKSYGYCVRSVEEGNYINTYLHRKLYTHIFTHPLYLRVIAAHGVASVSRID